MPPSPYLCGRLRRTGPTASWFQVWLGTRCRNPIKGFKLRLSGRSFRRRSSPAFCRRTKPNGWRCWKGKPTAAREGEFRERVETVCRAADRLAIALKSLTESKENRNSDLTPLAAKAEKGEGDGGAGSGRPAPKGEIMAETSISALRLVSLLEKIRGGLRRFWGTVRSTLASGGSHFPFYWSEWDSKDITTAADYLRDLDLAPDAERLLAEWSQWENLCDDLLRNRSPAGAGCRRGINEAL